MLTQLTIRNFVLVDELELDFHRAMNVLTGETGAGKSIILNALNLTLGERGSPSLIRDQSKRAEIIAVFEVNPQVKAWLEGRELLQENECILRRSLMGKNSKCFINGVPVTLDDMKQIARLLISLQGQHAHQQLMNRRTHLQFIDDFGGTSEAAADYRIAYADLLKLRRELSALQQTGKTDDRMLSLLRHELAELEEIAIPKQDYSDLEERHTRCNNREVLNEALNRALQILDGEQKEEERSLTQQFGALQQVLRQANDKFLNKLADNLTGAQELLETLQQELRGYATQADEDKEDFATLDDKMREIHRLARKHHTAPADLELLKEKKKEELATLDSHEERLAELNSKEQEIAARCGELAKTLTEKRKEAAVDFDKEVASKLHELDMECTFTTQFSPAADLSENGDNEVEFMLATAPGAALLPMRRIASGGELSRIALAVNLVAGRNSAIPSLVFDEVDSGIGGSVATTLGKMLAVLGARAQVICITHQPQIAVHADAHFAVTKSKKDNLIVSSIKMLSAMERKLEIGRMIGGERLKDDALDYAGKLIKQARPDVH